MCKNESSRLNYTCKLKKGVKVLNMANKKENPNYEDEIVVEVEPTDEELKKIAEDENQTSKFDENFFEVDVNNSSAFSKDEAYFYFRQIKKIRVCTHEEEVEYFKKIAAGDIQARDEFAERNLKLVVSNATSRIQQGSCFSMMDLVQEGNIGLLKAIEKFDISKGYKFSTYATWWIRQAMSRSMADQVRTIRIPAYMVEMINKYKRISVDFFQRYGYEPSLEEMAKELDISVERANEIAKNCEEMLSLYTAVGSEEEDTTVADLIESRDISVEEQYEKKETAGMIDELLNKLSDREKSILVQRYGIGTGEPKTLEEIGRELNVTRERIRQIEAKAIRKLRRHSVKYLEYLR